MEVAFFQFNKSPNSTKQRKSEGPKLDLNCELKEGSSVVNPTLLLTLQGNPAIWTYAAIPDFGNRYYFVRDWVNVQGSLWEVSLYCDVMGTYRLDILESTQFIERAESVQYRSLPDSLTVPLSRITTKRAIIDSPWRNTVYTYVVEISGGGSNVFYAMSSSEFLSFIRALFSDDYAESIFPGWADLYPELKANLNPLQYVSSVKLFPIRLLAGTGVTAIPVGWGIVRTSANIIPIGASFGNTYTIECPNHPQTSSAAFINGAPYSEYELYFPPFGTIPLDAGVIGTNDHTVNMSMRVDPISGRGSLVVMGGRPNVILATVEAQIGVSVGVGAVVNNGWGLGNSVSAGVSVIGKAISGDVGGSISSTAQTIDKFLGNMTPKLRATGGSSGFAALSGEISVFGRFQEVLFPDPTKVGNPFYQRAKISSLSGFIQCSNAHIEPKAHALATEIETIENYMNEGFYYE